MTKQTPPAFPRHQRLADGLGDRLRMARLRRRMSVTEMAERMGVSRTTLYHLEHGDLSVGLGVLVRALGVLGLEDDLAASPRTTSWPEAGGCCGPARKEQVDERGSMSRRSPAKWAWNSMPRSSAGEPGRRAASGPGWDRCGGRLRL